MVSVGETPAGAEWKQTGWGAALHPTESGGRRMDRACREKRSSDDAQYRRGQYGQARQRGENQPFGDARESRIGG